MVREQFQKEQNTYDEPAREGACPTENANCTTIRHFGVSRTNTPRRFFDQAASL